MVGDTGIEPATPTMSTAFMGAKQLYLLGIYGA